MNIRQIKIYLSRLYNALLGREFKEGRYFWQLEKYILELILEFIDGDRCGHPTEYTAEQYERKLQKVKQSILAYHDIDECWECDIDEGIAEYQKAQRKLLRGIDSIFFNLWD